MRELSISVGDLIRHIYMSGDLTSEYFQNADALDGIRTHQIIQKEYPEDAEKEVYIKTTIEHNDIKININGRIDGVFNTQVLTLEEIKSTRENVKDESFKIREQHKAQLFIYGYMYLKENELDKVKLRLKYANVTSLEKRDYYFEMTYKELEEFFYNTIQEFLDFESMLTKRKANYFKSLNEVQFPFGNYRKGQRDLMKASYITLLDDDVLYAIAPTGVGKTMALLFSSLKTIKESNEIIFYLTAKNSGKTVIKNSVDILSNKGLNIKTVELTAKEKICFKDQVKCDPEYCEYANGFFNRLKEATIDIYQNESSFFSNKIVEYSEKYTICPFEYSLYLGYFSDLIIGDYNYAFDPKTHLKRFFEEEGYKPILLVDEAHNMISRSLSMYSAELTLDTIKQLKKYIKPIKGKPVKVVKGIIDKFKEFGDLTEDNFHYQKEFEKGFVEKLENLMRRISDLLTENQIFDNRDIVVDCYFKIRDFVRIAEFYNDSYITIIETFRSNVIVKLSCLDASEFINSTLKEKCYGSVFFSASFEPIEYYKSLISEGNGRVVKISSPFPKENLNLIINNGISTRYKDRPYSIETIKETINILADSKVGNYIVFFPSYKYMNMVIDSFEEFSFYTIIQTQGISDVEKEDIIKMFDQVRDKSQVGFFVLGGVFSEGIDLIGDKLNGVVIVGVGLPMFNEYNNILKDFYDSKYKQGFDYAYTYKGFNKVIQAVGRVIRSETDEGVAILIDDRFTNYKYKSLVNLVWSDYKIIRSNKFLTGELEVFMK